MEQTLLILDGDAAVWEPDALGDRRLRACFLHDTLDLAGRLPGVEARVVTASDVPAALSTALARGPAILLASDVPHLPIWRLRDAFTHLLAGVELVAGPAEQGGWYLAGFAVGQRGLPAIEPFAGLDAALAQAGSSALLPAWYRLATAGDLRRLAADLRPMPPGVAAKTRALLDADGLQARVVGA